MDEKQDVLDKVDRMFGRGEGQSADVSRTTEPVVGLYTLRPDPPLRTIIISHYDEDSGKCVKSTYTGHSFSVNEGGVLVIVEMRGDSHFVTYAFRSGLWHEATADPLTREQLERYTEQVTTFMRDQEALRARIALAEQSAERAGLGTGSSRGLLHRSN